MIWCTSYKLSHLVFLQQVSDGGVHQLVDDRRHREDASYDGHQLNKQTIPARVFAHLQLGQRIRRETEHDHGHWRQQ